MKSVLGSALALVLLAGAGASHADVVETQLAPPRTVLVRDLIGLTPREVQHRLTGLDVDWPRITGLEILSGPDRLSFAAADDVLGDPAAVALAARARTRGKEDPRSGPPAWSRCAVQGEAGRHGALILMFRNDHLDSIWNGASGPRPAADTLPFDDAPAFLARWGRTPTDPDTPLTLRCARHEIDTGLGPASERQRLSASDMQGLAMAPLAVGLPAMNGKRAEHRREGPALYAQLEPGYRLPASPRDFAARHVGARVVHQRDPGYAILAINLGGEPSRNLSNIEDFGLVGVRDGVVIWRGLDYSLAGPRLPASK